MSEPTLQEKLRQALRQGAQMLGITGEPNGSRRGPLAEQVRDALDVASSCTDSESLEQIYQAVKACAHALGITSDLRGSRRGPAANLIREAVAQFERTYCGEQVRKKILKCEEQSVEKIFKSEVRCDDEYAEIPAVAVYSIDEPTARKIISLSQVVMQHDLYKVELFDYRVRYYKSQDKEQLNRDDVERTDSDTLIVTATKFWFAGYLKHTDIEVMTEPERIADLAAHFGLEYADGDAKELETNSPAP